MTMLDLCRYALTRRTAGHRFARVLLVSAMLLAGTGWSGESAAQKTPARVGFLSFFAVADNPRMAAFQAVVRRTLADLEWIEGKNVMFEYRNAKGDPSRLDEAAASLVELDVDVIFASSASAVRAAYTATRTIPIVAVDYTTDAIAEGYIENYARPGGNVTGVFLDAPEFAGKWFELLKTLIPNLSHISVLWDPGTGDTHLRAVRSVARSLGIQLEILEVRTLADIDTAFESMRGQPQAAIFLPSPMIHGQSARLARLALKHRLPATSMALAFADAGGVLAYGPEGTSTYERNAMIVAKILEGANPAKLPVERPTEIKLVVNLKSAKTLGISIPRSILLRADEVIR